ncbi:hypothetical protein SK128_008303 [Halocaridina rubra]|uniref:Uncharacterized protein n=1 Tax=Halocaridina rubra TaxID=373956 RepID=A0AAN9ADM6_HALRR
MKIMGMVRSAIDLEVSKVTGVIFLFMYFLQPLSASLTSLPLIDLSLDIELPPPIMASLGYSFPVTFDDDKSYGCGGGDEDGVVGNSSSSHFRSPKLLHDSDFKASAAADHSVTDSHIWGHTHSTPSGHTYSTPSSTSLRSDASNISAVCTGYATAPREHKKAGTLGQFRDYATYKCSSSSTPSSLCKDKTTIHTSDSPRTCHALTSSSSKLLSSQCGHASSLSLSKSPQLSRQVNVLKPSSTHSLRSGSDFPKYGASQAFSASLSRYSTKRGTPGYFYSKLTKSIDDDGPVDEFEAIEYSEDFTLCSPLNIPQASFSSPTQPGYAGNLLFFSSASHTTDIMTMSLPAVLTSISPPLQCTSPQGRSLSPSPLMTHPPSPPCPSHRPLSPVPCPSKAHSKQPCRSLSPLPPPPSSLGRRTRSPSPHLGIELGSGEEDGNGQDLIFLESPQDEIFDPLLSKDIPLKTRLGGRPNQPPPPVPLSTKSSSSLPGKSSPADMAIGSMNTSSLPAASASSRSSAINTTGLPNTTTLSSSNYRPLTPYQATTSEYRPFSTIQTNLGVPVGCQNPMYNQHNIPGGNLPPSTTRSGSAAVVFAASMLSQASDDTSSKKCPRQGQYVQFDPPLSQSQSSGLSSQPQRPPRLSQRDLLGDFSNDFQKLSVNSSSRAASPGNNNNTVVNNNKTCDPGSKKGVVDSSGPKWATFD